MALPKKGTRKINVNEVVYRYIGDAYDFEGISRVLLIAELAENPRQKIRATFNFDELNSAYKKTGHRLSKIADKVPPFFARACILLALKSGWQPESGKGVLDLGDVTGKIDLKLINPNSQNSG